MSSGDRTGESAASSRLTGALAVARIGAVVDRYTIVRLLGHGGMGAVYEARHATLARRVAIKFLLPELAANPDVLRRFENEAKAAGGLEHPNLVAVTDLGSAADGSPYLVMEFLEGQDCAALLARQGALPVARAVNIVVQACRGLALAHQHGIVHRDLKPENLFLTDAGDGSDLVKVLDFGIAKLRSSETGVATGTGATFGTAYYMSPEQARGAGDVDQRADVWSLGIVLYQLLSAQRPFEGEQFLQVIHQILSATPTPLARLRPGLPAGLTAAISGAMTKDVAARLPSVKALAELLAPFDDRVTHEPASSKREVLAAAAGSPLETTAATPPTLPSQQLPPQLAPASSPAASGRPVRRKWPWLAVLAVGAAIGAAAIGLRRGPPAPRSADAPVEAALTAPPAAAGAPPPATPPTPAPPSSEPERSRPSAPVTPAAAAAVSEQIEQRSNRRKAAQKARRGPMPSSGRAATKPADGAPPAADKGNRANRPIEIERSNPYDP
jgi:serine/threonine-protein kinase